jgi:hypothetical protein
MGWERKEWVRKGGEGRRPQARRVRVGRDTTSKAVWWGLWRAPIDSLSGLSAACCAHIPCLRHLSAAMSRARRRMKASLLHAASSRGPSSSLAVCRAMSSAARAAPPRWFLPCRQQCQYHPTNDGGQHSTHNVPL